MKKIIVNFTPTGMIPTKNDTPYVPISVKEIVRDVRIACDYGITMVHLHARDVENEVSTYRKEVYAEIISGIREYAPDLIICVSTSGRLHSTFEKRSEVLQLEGDVKPDMASLTLSSLNFNHMASINEPEMIVALAEEMKAKGIKPELEIFDLGMSNYMKYLIRKKVLEPPYYANLILGNIACAQLNLSHIGCILQDFEEGTEVSLGGVGNAQFKANALAVAMGYGVRVGLEDDFWFDNERTVLAQNEDLLRRICHIIEVCESQPMSPKELRAKLGLNGY